MVIKQSFDRCLSLFTALAIVVGWQMLNCRTVAAGLFEDAVEGEADAEQSPATSRSALELNGYVRGDLYMGKAPDKDVTEIKNGYAEAAAKLKVLFGDWGDGRGEIRLRQGYNGAEVRGEFDLREAFVDLYLGPVDIRLGHQIIVWGRADAFNPTDNLTPHDMRVRSPNEDDRRAANLSLSTTFYFDPVNIELIYVPFYAPSHFPVFELPGPISFTPPDYPDMDFEHGTAASRLNMVLPEVGFSVSYLFGYSTFPGLSLADFSFGPPPEVSVRFSAYRHHVAGLDFSTTIGDCLGLRGEAALRWPVDEPETEHVPLPDVQYVLGVDREFGDFSVIVQYVGRTVLKWEQIEPTGLLELAQGKTPTPEQLERILADPEGAARDEVERKTRMISGQTERYSHAVTARLAWKLLQETLELELLGSYNFTTGEWLVRPKISYSITDGLDAVAGAEIYGGPDDTLYGTIDETMSAGFVELIAYF